MEPPIAADPPTVWLVWSGRPTNKSTVGVFPSEAAANAAVAELRAAGEHGCGCGPMAVGRIDWEAVRYG